MARDRGLRRKAAGASWWRPVAAVVSLGVAFTANCAHGLTGADIAARAHQAAYYSGSDFMANGRMIVYGNTEEPLEREYNILRLNTSNGGQKFYIYFTLPADVREIAYLTWKKPDTEDERWIWDPEKKVAERILPGNKRSRFVGSDITYEDIAGRGLHEDTFELLRTTDTVYIVKATPVKPSDVEFSYYLLWVDRFSFLPLKTEYFDRDAKPYRTIKTDNIQNIQGYPTIVGTVTSNLRTGSQTRNTFKKIKYDTNLREQIFTGRYLYEPPEEISQ